jgi:hypothetical protein
MLESNASHKKTELSSVLNNISNSLGNDVLAKTVDNFFIRTAFFASGTALLTGVITHLQGGQTDMNTVKTAAGLSAFISFLGPQLGYVATQISRKGLEALYTSILNKWDDINKENPDVAFNQNNFKRLSNDIESIIAEQDFENPNYWIVKTDKGKLLKIMTDDNYKNTFVPMLEEKGIRLLETSIEREGIIVREKINGVLDSRHGPAEVEFYNNNGNYEVLYSRFFIDGTLIESEEEYNNILSSHNQVDPTITK